MKFLFDLNFWMIAIVVIGVFLFYEPVATGIFLGAILVISIIGAMLVLKYRHR